MRLKKQIGLAIFILGASSLSFADHAGTTERDLERQVETSKNAGNLDNLSEDPCLRNLIQEAKKTRSTTSVRSQEQVKASQARTFLDFIEKGTSQASSGSSSGEENLYKFLQAISSGDPVRDKSHLWHQEGGMSMPENFQNLVVTLESFSSASDNQARREILKEAIDHLGWLTSTNFHVPPARGSGFTDNRYLYDYAQNWLACLEKQQKSSSASSGASGSKNTPKFSKVGPISKSQLEETLNQAKENGYQHVVVRYGNDRICSHCRKLGKELEEEFKTTPGVLIIAVEGSQPLPGQGIPQSESYSLTPEGSWKQSGSVHVGSGKSGVLKEEIQKAHK